MDKILSKWYFGLIIMPVLVNILTNSIGFPDFFNNWLYTIIAILIIFISILIIELYQLNQKYKVLKFTPKESDKKIVKELLEVLDIDLFHEEIKEQDSWYGYSQEAIKKATGFARKAELISYQTSSPKVNELILDLKNAIEDFASYSAKQLYSEGKQYSPAKDTEYNLKRAEKASPIMNEKASIAFSKLSILLEYLKERNYFE